MKGNGYDAIIRDVEKTSLTTAYIKQGIKGNSQHKFDKSKYYHGSNGTYAFRHESSKPELLLKLAVCDYPQSGSYKNIDIDIYDYVLEQNGRKRLSDNVLQYIINKNKGRKIRVMENEESISFDLLQIDVTPKK